MIEAERVYRDTDLQLQHPEWLLGPQGDNYLVNLGNPAARKGITQIVSSLIREGGLAWYRQDFNTDPEKFWSDADPADRVGMTEIRYIEGLYAFWDELRQRHPGLLIDNFASGGRRLDLETISRSVALWRSDFQCNVNFNLPACKGNPWDFLLDSSNAGVVRSNDPYRFSGLSPGIIINMPQGQPQQLKELLEEARRIQPFFLGDYYPLTPIACPTATGWLCNTTGRSGPTAWRSPTVVRRAERSRSG